MSSLLAFYREAPELVIALWNERAGELGLEALGPLKVDEGSWDIFQERKGHKLFVGVYRHSEHLTRLLVEPGVGQDDLFEKVLELGLRPVELLLVNLGWEFVSESLFCESGGMKPTEYVDLIDRFWTCWGVRRLHAVHRELLVPLEEYSSAARERGFTFFEFGEYHVLSVHWNERLPWPELHCPVSGLPAFQAEKVDSELSSDCGQMIRLNLTDLKPNPRREHQPWLDTLPRVAQALSDFLGDGDSLWRLYTPRDFLMIKPGLPLSELGAELQSLRSFLSRELAPLLLGGTLSVVSWPEDVSNWQSTELGEGWDRAWEKLLDRDQSFPL